MHIVACAWKHNNTYRYCILKVNTRKYIEPYIRIKNVKYGVNYHFRSITPNAYDVKKYFDSF